MLDLLVTCRCQRRTSVASQPVGRTPAAPRSGCPARRSSGYRAAVDMRELMGSAPVPHLATVAADGQPHVVPVCFVMLGELAYTAGDLKPKRGSRVRRTTNIEAAGRACVQVGKDHQYAQLPPAGPVLAVDTARRSSWFAA